MMATRIRTAVLVVSVLAALLIAAALVAWLMVDTDQVKKRIEAGLSDILNMDVQVGQPLHFSLLQGPNVTIADLEVSRQGQVVATAESVSVGLATFSLLTGNVHPIDLHIKRPELMVERTSPGVFNIYEAEPGELDTLSLRRLRVSDARFTYLDQASEMKWLFEHCDLDLRNLHHNGGMPEQALASLAAEGDLQCQTLSQGRFKVSELSAEVRGDNGVFELKPVSAIVFEGESSGWIEADLSSRTPALRLEYRLAEFDFGAFMGIDQMVSEWTIEGGVAQARDVAFRTPQNRLALIGALDFGNYRFQDMQVAVIDSDGCAVVEQRITGPFHEPEIERPNVLVAVTGPMVGKVEPDSPIVGNYLPKDLIL